MIWETQGFELIKDFFKKSIDNGHLSHAYIFSGQEMIGKRTFTLELAAKINKSENSLNNPDTFTVTADSSESGESIPIGKVREAKNFLSLSAYHGPYKFVIIDDADKMTVESQNAFLKILEEPSASSIIIMVTAYPEVLLPTIASRCQEIKFPNHLRGDIEKGLLLEGVSKEKAEFLSQFANGRLGLALNIARNDRYAEVKDHISDLADVKKATLDKRLQIAKSLSEKESGILKEKFLFWMLYLNMHKSAPDSANVLKNLIELNYLLGQPQYNRRLMLENFMVKL